MVSSSGFLNTQSPLPPKVIRALLENTGDLPVDDRADSILSLIFEAKKTNFYEGVVFGYYRLGRHYALFGNFEESIKSFSTGESYLVKLENDDNLYSLIYNGLAENYYRLGFNDEAIIYARMAFNFGLRWEGLEVGRVIKMRANHIIGEAYLHKKVDYGLDSAQYYFHLVIDQAKIKDIPNAEIQKLEEVRDIILVSSLGEMGNIWMEKNDLDSGAYYLKQAQSYVIKGPEASLVKLKLTTYSARLYFENQNFDRAIVQSRKALEMEKDLVFPALYLRKQLFQYLFMSYENLENHDLANEYRKMYMSLADSLNILEKSGVSSALRKVHAKKDLEYQEVWQSLNEWKWLAGIATVLFTIIVVVLVIALKNAYRRRKEALLEKEGVSQEVIELRQKINVSFDNVVEMAKNNDPALLATFREIYPQFCDNLFDIAPDLTNEELKFCALLFLDFSTKDIARYTFVEPKTVYMKKYRIRKRLKIGGDTDLYYWTKQLQFNN